MGKWFPMGNHFVRLSLKTPPETACLVRLTYNKNSPLHLHFYSISILVHWSLLVFSSRSICWGFLVFSVQHLQYRVLCRKCHFEYAFAHAVNSPSYALHNKQKNPCNWNPHHYWNAGGFDIELEKLDKRDDFDNVSKLSRLCGLSLSESTLVTVAYLLS